MRSLLDDRFAPLTFAWGFLEAPLETVREALTTWRQGHHRTVEYRSIEASLPAALLQLEPLTTLRRRELLLATKSSWTACFDNSARGGDPFGTVSHLATVLKCRGLLIRCIPASAIQFELFAPEQRDWLNYERAIGVGHDERRWTFIDQGTPLPFERIERYSRKEIRERFTPEMLEEYCAALGLRLFDDGFYGPKCALVVVADPLPAGHMKLTLAEARERIGLSDA